MEKITYIEDVIEELEQVKKDLQKAKLTLSIIGIGFYELSHEKIENEYCYFKKIARECLKDINRD